MLKVSVIVLSLNGEKVIGNCLESLLKTNYPDLEFIVVNNGSTDSTADIVAKYYPPVKLINLSKNLGFAGGNNRGLSQATGDILILLNDDTTVHPDWVKELIQVMNNDSQIGIAGCKIYYPDGKTIQHAGGYINSHGLSNHYGKGEPDNIKYNIIRDVDYVMGAAFAIKRELINKLGLLDEKYYPIYFEETDYCYRARKMGYRVLYVPNSIIYHHEAQSTVMFSAGFFYKYHKNRLRFMLLNFSNQQLSQAIEPELRWLYSIRNSIEFKSLLRAYAFNFIRLPLLFYARIKSTLIG